MKRSALRSAGLLLLLGILCAGCRSFTKTAADREVYGILDDKRTCVPELVGSLHVEAQDGIAQALREQRTFVLDVDDAVELAMITRREYRTQRENVYLAALALTFERHQFRGIFAAGAFGEIEFDEGGAVLDGAADWSVSRALATGGSIVLGLATDFLSNLTGDTLRTAQTLIDSEIVLPMARGAGRLVTLEPLRQAERDTLYALRDFARDQQDLRVDISARFYNVLALRDVIANEERAYESLQRLVEEQTERAKAGDVRDFQVDLARQDLVTADERRLVARRRYLDALDQLKLDLGIPMAVELELDAAGLIDLREAGLGEVPYSLQEALATADRRRLDLKNARDREQDAKRQIAIAANALEGDVDFIASGSLVTPSENPFDLRRATPRGTAGLDIDLPLERMAERNAYVRAKIASMRAFRARQRLDDLVDFEVRASWRALEVARRSYEIQAVGVGLAERRVESTGLLLQEGSADIRARLEAEDARVRARNALTVALVEYTLSLLEFERDVGTLEVTAPDLDAVNGFPPAVPDVGAAATPEAEPDPADAPAEN